MASAKKSSSNSKSSSPSSKKGKLGSPMKKKSSSSQNKKSPNKKQSNSPKKSTNKNQRTGGSSTKHPNYQRMVTEALTTLDSRKGSSRSKILNHIKSTYGVESGKSANKHLRSALETLLEESIVALAKGTGYSNGYYRMTPKGKKNNLPRIIISKKTSRTKIIGIIISFKIKICKSNPWSSTKQFKRSITIFE